ncbi:PP2C family serine/threonine-protein phosphatase [Sporobolomyces salmoneus]|uniref:PP2C family serine/threonine-protein phosphatase n=1 Tax=Sporobolomyces salmoneus TaxID=183962 RepID=UPI003172B1FD
MSKSPKSLLPSSLSFSQISRAAAQSSSSSSSSSSQHHQQRIRRYVVGATAKASNSSTTSGSCVVVRQRRPVSTAQPRSTDSPLQRGSTTGFHTSYQKDGPRNHFSTSSSQSRVASVSPSSCSPCPSSPASGIPSPPHSPPPTSSSSPGPSGKHHSSLTSTHHAAGGGGSENGESDVLLHTPPLTSSSSSHSSSSTSSSTLTTQSTSKSLLFGPASSSNNSSRIPSHVLPSFFGSSSLATPFRGNLVFRNGAYGIPKNNPQSTRKGKEKLLENAPSAAGEDGEGGGEHHLSVSVGEDAYFLRNDSLGVADGVGGWSGHAGANPARWARKFMHHCSAELARYENIDDEMFLQYYQVDPVEVMQRAFEQCLRESKDEGIIGSSTALLAVLRNDELHLANLGDCYCCVIRDNDYIFRSEEQQHSFNFPFQAGTNSKDTPGKDAQRFMVKVKKDDIVLLASDGLVDNVFSDDLLEEILRFVSVSPSPSPSPVSSSSTNSSSTSTTPRYTLNKFSPQLVSETLCYRAKSVYDDPRAVASPFQNRAVEEGLYYAGGKKDDVTCLIGVVGELEASPNRRDVA